MGVVDSDDFETGTIDSDDFETGAVDSDDFDMGANCVNSHLQANIISTGTGDRSDEEYETWGGFGSGTYLSQCRWL